MTVTVVSNTKSYKEFSFVSPRYKATAVVGGRLPPTPELVTKAIITKAFLQFRDKL